MSDDGIRSYKKTLEELKKEPKEERLGQAIAWDTYCKENGLDIEWKHKRNKGVSIR